MIEVLHTDNGDIKAVCEWYIVDETGNWNKEGKYIWVNEVFVSKNHERSGCLKEFVRLVTNKVPWFEYGYFWRQRKYPDRKARLYTRQQWLRLIK